MISLVQSLVDSLALGSLYALFALGIALVFGVMNLINFAHGELVMVGAFAALLISDVNPAALILGVVAITALFAFATEAIAFRPVRNATPATLLVTSFTVSYLLRSLAALILGSAPRNVTLLPQLSQPMAIGGVSISRLSVATIVTVVVLLSALGWFLSRTTMGLHLRAATEDFVAARLLGVRANVVIATGFTLSGGLAAMAAILLVTQTGQVYTTMGSGPVLVAFIATILGGLGSLRGAVLGGLLLGTLTVALQTYLPFEVRPYRDAFAYALVIVVLLVRPEGLLPAKGRQLRI